LPDRAVARALDRGEISRTLPFINKTLVAKAQYSSDTQAAKSIPEAVLSYYKQNHSDTYSQRLAEITPAADTAVQIYSRHVFSELKVDWATYPNNLGHTDFPGCLRCHDDLHAAADKQIAIDEPAPEALKVFGLEAK
jgi:hypothetical protein